jgi:hypothetical protein
MTNENDSGRGMSENFPDEPSESFREFVRQQKQRMKESRRVTVRLRLRHDIAFRLEQYVERRDTTRDDVVAEVLDKFLPHYEVREIDER